jgi:hypothetical protein
MYPVSHAPISVRGLVLNDPPARARFDKGWDDTLIEKLLKCGDRDLGAGGDNGDGGGGGGGGEVRAVLTGYPLGYRMSEVAVKGGEEGLDTVGYLPMYGGDMKKKNKDDAADADASADAVEADDNGGDGGSAATVAAVAAHSFGRR